MNEIYKMVSSFMGRYPNTIAWRIKKHCKVAALNLNDDENLRYAFACQKNCHFYDIFRTYVVVVTDKRIFLVQKRMIFGYLFLSITPDMYNDLSISSGLIWGMINIDTVKETIYLSNIEKRALPEIEDVLSSFIAETKNNEAC